jgi:alpha-N-arabinofuranosidase
MHHDDVKAINTEENPNNVVPSPAVTRPAEGGELAAVLPALSWNMIRLIK